MRKFKPREKVARGREEKIDESTREVAVAFVRQQLVNETPDALLKKRIAKNFGIANPKLQSTIITRARTAERSTVIEADSKERYLAAAREVVKTLGHIDAYIESAYEWKSCPDADGSLKRKKIVAHREGFASAIKIRYGIISDFLKLGHELNIYSTPAAKDPDDDYDDKTMDEIQKQTAVLIERVRAFGTARMPKQLVSSIASMEKTIKLREEQLEYVDGEIIASEDVQELVAGHKFEDNEDNELAVNEGADDEEA